jgi:uncharacterized glyoxalase superfamily protein PhnB
VAETPKRSSLSSSLSYQDPKAALEFLEKAFGFETAMVITDASGTIVHSEMRYDGCLLMVGGEWSELHKSPKSIGGLNTQSLHVHVEEDIDGHCARARRAGATILQEPAEQFYGDRTYRAADLEGHIWSFGQTVRAVSREEAEKLTGFKIDGWV